MRPSHKSIGEEPGRLRLAAPGPGTRGQTMPVFNILWGTVFYSWQPQEMLKRMVVYQTAFRQVQRHPW